MQVTFLGVSPQGAKGSARGKDLSSFVVDRVLSRDEGTMGIFFSEVCDRELAADGDEGGGLKLGCRFGEEGRLDTGGAAAAALTTGGGVGGTTGGGGVGFGAALGTPGLGTGDGGGGALAGGADTAGFLGAAFFAAAFLAGCFGAGRSVDLDGGFRRAFKSTPPASAAAMAKPVAVGFSSTGLSGGSSAFTTGGAAAARFAADALFASSCARTFSMSAVGAISPRALPCGTCRRLT